MQMEILILDDSLKIEIFYERQDADFTDNICISFEEDCPDDERIFRASLTNIYLTCEQARKIALALYNAAEVSAEQCDQDKDTASPWE
jgi:hypothetical protein